MFRTVDVTPEFCGQIFQPGGSDYDAWTTELTEENVKRLRGMKENDPGAPGDAEEVISALLSRAEQRVLCHQDDRALADLMLWPETSRRKMTNDFADSIRDVSPDFAKRLGEASQSK